MQDEKTISRSYAVGEVRRMAVSFAELYFTFAAELREDFGEEEALRIIRKVLFRRAKERAEEMRRRARDEGMERIPENITKLTDVPYLGWDPALGREMCPYGAAWNKRIAEHPWFRRFACLYCDVTDTTIAEVFTGTHTHRLLRKVVQGDDDCDREYIPSEDVQNGRYTYGE